MQPLVVTRDPLLLDDLARVAAGAGVQFDVRGDPVAALATWSSAPMVVIGDDLVAEMAGVGPPARSEVVVVCRSADQATFRWALEVGAGAVIELPVAEAHLGAMFADADEAPARGLVLGVVGGAGGSGASTLACALGQVGGRSAPTLVIDTDPLGPGLDRLLGLDDIPGVRWGDLTTTAGRLGSRSLREAVPRRDGVGVLTWHPGAAASPTASVLRDVLAAGQRGHRLVVLDLARHTEVLSEELMARCDLILAVTPSSVAGVASTLRLLSLICDTSPMRLATRRGPVSAADLSAATGLPVAMEVPEQRGLAEAVDLGFGPIRGRREPLGRAAASFLAAVA